LEEEDDDELEEEDDDELEEGDDDEVSSDLGCESLSPPSSSSSSLASFFSSVAGSDASSPSFLSAEGCTVLWCLRNEPG
jgi:hypothetical protein